MKQCPCGAVCRNYRVRPPVPTGDAVKTIPLGGGLYAYVDAADYDWLNQWHWRVWAGGYAMRREKGKYVFMHREIMKPPRGMITDHVNGNKLDNTRANLRNTTQQQNVHNMAKRFDSDSTYKGVSYDKRSHRWRSRVCVGKRCFWLGYFDSEVEAARAYDRAAVGAFGEFARLNFPEEWPPERIREVRAKWLREQARQKRRAVRRGQGSGAGGQGKRSRRRGRAAGACEGRKGATRKAKRVTKRPARPSPARVRR